MSGETDLVKLIKEMKPELNQGEFVFITIDNIDAVSRLDTLFEFKEKEGITMVLQREKADVYGFKYDFVASWITLKVHSALEAVGLTAIFSSELAKYDISCNVIAGYYHDHIFVDIRDGFKALEVLKNLSQMY